jgi:hypothetical protein
MRLREQVATGTGVSCADGGAPPSSVAEKQVPPLAGPGWADAESALATSRTNELLAAVTGNEPDEKLRAAVLELVLIAGQAPHQPHCPVRMLDGISHDSLKGLVADLSRDALLFLFAAERKCRSAGGTGTGA